MARLLPACRRDCQEKFQIAQNGGVKRKILRRAKMIMETEANYRVVAVCPDGQRLVLDESLAIDRAEQMRQVLLQMNAYPEIVVEPDMADHTPRLTVEDGNDTDTVAFSD